MTSGNIADSDQTAALGPVDVLVAYAGVGRTRSLVRGGGSHPALTLGSPFPHPAVMVLKGTRGGCTRYRAVQRVPPRGTWSGIWYRQRGEL